jgi:hypothetical protein
MWNNTAAFKAGRGRSVAQGYRWNIAYWRDRTAVWRMQYKCTFARYLVGRASGRNTEKGMIL